MGSAWMIDEDTPHRAADIGQRFELGEQALALLTDGQTSREYFDLLYKYELHKDAVRFLAYLLPKREAAWWGSLCVWQVGRPQPAQAIDDAVHAVVTWVIDPTEANRQAAQKAGKLAKGTSAGQVALAVFWSGGSMSAPGLPAVAPPPYLTNQTIAAAILGAANGGNPAKRFERYLQFLWWGCEVADGTNLWT